MAMDTGMTIASALAGINVVLLLVLTGVWVRNYRQFRSRLLLGLVAFGAVMVAENAVAIYYFLSQAMLYTNDPGVGTAVLVLRTLEFVAVLVLTWVTIQ